MKCLPSFRQWRTKLLKSSNRNNGSPGERSLSRSEIALLQSVRSAPGATFVDVKYNIASYETSVSVEETKKAVRKLLTDQGWKVLGWPGNRLILQQNAVELTAYVEELSRQSGKTRIAYWTEQLSTDSRTARQAKLSKYEADDQSR